MGGALAYKSDKGVHTNTSNQRAISDNFLAKNWVTDSKRDHWVRNCTKSRQFYYFLKFPLRLTKIFQNLMILPDTVN